MKEVGGNGGRMSIGTDCAEERRGLLQSRWQFVGVCAYLLSQAYMIPICSLGPSWPVWPTLADLSVALLLCTCLLRAGQSRSLSLPNRTALRGLLFIVIGCLISYGIVTILMEASRPLNIPKLNGRDVGAYQIYRMMQSLFVFWAVAQVELNPSRTAILRHVVTFTLIAICVPMLLTFVSVFEAGIFTAHLPADRHLSPWPLYSIRDSRGWGTISYNHSYTSVQILLLAALRIHLSDTVRAFANGFCLMLGLLCIFISGSRAGLAAAVFFTLVIFNRRPIYVALAVLATTAAPFVLELLSDSWKVQLSLTGERQATLFALDDSDNVNRRTDVWKAHIAFLSESPIRWLVGTGFGSGLENIGAGHNQYLHFIIETGLLGLLIWLMLFLRILGLLGRFEGGERAILWVTVALLLSCVTQETFYAVPVMGHFCGFYFCAVAIALRRRQDVAARPQPEPSVSPLAMGGLLPRLTNSLGE